MGKISRAFGRLRLTKQNIPQPKIGYIVGVIRRAFGRLRIGQIYAEGNNALSARAHKVGEKKYKEELLPIESVGSTSSTSQSLK